MGKVELVGRRFVPASVHGWSLAGTSSVHAVVFCDPSRKYWSHRLTCTCVIDASGSEWLNKLFASRLLAQFYASTCSILFKIMYFYLKNTCASSLPSKMPVLDEILVSYTV